MLNFQEKKYKEAEEIFSRLRDSAPLDTRASLLLAETFLAQGRTADARSLLQTEVSKNPKRDDLRMSWSIWGTLR